MADISKFIVNSDFPMPAQTGVVTAKVTMPAGTANYAEVSTTVTVEGANLFRTSIRSSRLSKVFVGANSVLYKVGNDIFVCTIGSSTGGVVTLRIVNFGSAATTTAETVTFTLSCFKFP